MLINLSSQGELDPAKFSNSFSESVVIKPFSYIALIKGQIIRLKNQKQISILPDTVLYVRFTCYDVHTLILNPGGTANLVLTIPALVSYIQGRFAAMGYPYANNIEVVEVEGGDGDTHLDFKFYEFLIDPTIGLTWKSETFGNNNYWTTKFGECIGYGGAVVGFPGGAVEGESLSYIYNSAVQPYNWCISPIWDTDQYTAPTNQNNYNSFNLLTSPNMIPNAVNGYAPLQYWIGQPNAMFSVSLGRTETQTIPPANPIITIGPISSTPNDNPNSGPKNHLLHIQHEARHPADGLVPGLTEVVVFNNQTGTWTAPISQLNQAGDYWEIAVLPATGAIQDYQNMYYVRVNRYANQTGMWFAYNGNVGAITDRPGGNNYFLSTNIVPPTDTTAMSNISFIYDNEYMKINYTKRSGPGLLDDLAVQWENDFKQTTTQWNGLACIGVRTNMGFRNDQLPYQAPGCGWVYSRPFGQPATKQFLVSYEDGQSDQCQYRYAAGVWGFADYAGIGQRANGSKIEIPNAYRVQPNEIVCNVPTLIVFSVSFNVAAEALIPAALSANVRTLLGGNVSGRRMFEVQLNQAATALPLGWDFRLTDEDGNTYTNVLVDGAGNRINFRGSNNATGYTYNFMVRWYGTTVNTFQITVAEHESATGLVTVFDMATTMTIANNSYPRGWNTFGGINPISDLVQEDYNDYSPLSYWGNMRIYQKSIKSDAAPNTEADWDFECLGLTQYFQLIPNYATTNFWYNSSINAESPPGMAYFPFAVNTQLLPTNPDDEAFWNIGTPQSNTNTGVIIERADTGTVPQDTNAPLINNLWIPPCQFSPNASRTTNLSNFAYTGMGEGLVDVDSAELVFDFTDPEPDGFDNIIQVPQPVVGEGPNNPTSRIMTEADIAIVDNEAMNVEITNLTHRTMNGTNRSMDKTIYQMPMITDTEEIGDQEIVECTPPSKVWIPLNNPGPLPINRLDVQISNIQGQKIEVLHPTTNITVQIEDNISLLN